MTEFAFVDRTHCICGATLRSAGAKEWRHPWGVIAFKRCEQCNSWCQSPQVSVESIAAWYDSDLYQGSNKQSGRFYANYVADEESRLIEARERWRRDLSYLLPKPGSRVLEVGCATGSLLAVIRDNGHQVNGLDLSSRFAKAAADLHRLEVTVGDVAKANFPAGTFDLVILAGTLPNLHRLADCLRRIHCWLKPGGYFVANFPATDSLTARLYGRSHWMFAPSANTFPSTLGCSTALANAGFSIDSLKKDVQRPSWRKLMTLSRIPFGDRMLALCGLRGRKIPIPISAPGVRIIVAKKPFIQYS